MRRPLFARALLLLVPAVLAIAAVASAAPNIAKPRVWIVNEKPAVVRGTGFKPREQVRVSLAAGSQRMSKVVKATMTGIFVARWTTPLVADCGNKLVTATGSMGTRAVFKVVANDCAPWRDPVN